MRDKRGVYWRVIENGNRSGRDEGNESDKMGKKGKDGIKSPDIIFQH